jgi:hypothetical protein
VLLVLIVAGFFAGLVDSVAGGGGLISLPALLLLGLPPQLALGTNKVIGIATALASSSRYRLSGVMSWRKLAPLATAACAAGGGGAFTATLVPSEKLRPILLVLLVAAGLFVLLRNRLGMERAPDARRAGWLFLAAPAIGFYDGFFGPGTGTFLMLSFVLLAGDDLLSASGKGRAVNLATNLGALAVFSARGLVDLPLVLPAAAASFTGGLVGASWAIRKGPALIRPVFVAVTWALIAKVAWDLFARP